MGTADGEGFPKDSAFPLVPEKKSKIQVSGESSKVFQVMGTVWSHMERQENAEHLR